MLNKLVILALAATACLAQDYDEYQPPVRQSARYNQPQAKEQPKKETIAILKQINRHNEDGSYTYGYEGADGSFKIETKAADGEVKGKYGYVDESGKVKVVEYGANKYGFQPSGEGITVPPVNYNDFREVDYEDEQQQPQQQFISRPKQAPKAQRPQAFNYAPAAPVEKRKPAYMPTPAPVQYYDYEEEVQTTPRPIQLARPKYAVQQPQPQRQQQFGLDAGVVYAQTPRPSSQPSASFFQQFDNRQPAQFPKEAPAPQQLASRADQFNLFQPAAPRPTSYTPKFEQFEQESFQFAPQPQPTPQQPYQRPSFAAQPAQSRSTSILDQLAKDPNFKLPQSSPALHDISFGYAV